MVRIFTTGVACLQESFGNASLILGMLTKLTATQTGTAIMLDSNRCV